MGGFGSTRWGWTATRPTTDGLPALDVRRLARQGALAPGRHAITWGNPVGVTSGVTLVAEAGAVVLDYRVPDESGSTTEVRDRITLARTACHYGGGRPWFVCPGCGDRRAVLYFRAGLFRCRDCHDLAYGSSREVAWERARRRAEGVRARLLAEWESGPVPSKPLGMHWRTYARLVNELATTDRLAQVRVVARASALLASLDAEQPQTRPAGTDSASRPSPFAGQLSS